MLQLFPELINEIITEVNTSNEIGVYAGGFKPPTKGHFDVLIKALKENPDLKKLIIYVGSKERNGITQEQSLLIWDIYKKYLPFKVEIISSKIPISDVYKLSKDNPDSIIKWFIGAREGKEEDFKDFAARTKASVNYPNIKPIHLIMKSDISGTKFRESLKNKDINSAKLMLPSVLKNDEVLNIIDILSSTINEEITKTELLSVEKIADKWFSLYGIDIEFTKHFLDRLNDPRNKKDITREELLSFFKKIKDRYGKKLSKEHESIEAVFKSLSNDINLPFVLQPKNNTQEKELVTKTIMRKKDFKTTSPILTISENDNKRVVNIIKSNLNKIINCLKTESKETKQVFNILINSIKDNKKLTKEEKVFCIEQLKDIFKTLGLTTLLIIPVSTILFILIYLLKGQKYLFPSSYNTIQESYTNSENINLQEYLDKLLDHYKKEFSKINEWPELNIIDNDEENSSNFFGKTAYYDPNNFSITLYINNRHPKDIARSFSHELIHHIQNKEGRLQNYQTQNVNEDKHLEEIEKEAYLKGNIIFRKWENNINKKED